MRDLKQATDYQGRRVSVYQIHPNKIDWLLYFCRHLFLVYMVSSTTRLIKTKHTLHLQIANL